MILIAPAVFLLAFGLLWWAFAPRNEWRIESDDVYDITPLWRTRR